MPQRAAMPAYVRQPYVNAMCSRQAWEKKCKLGKHHDVASQYRRTGDGHAPFSLRAEKAHLWTPLGPRIVKLSSVQNHRRSTKPSFVFESFSVEGQRKARSSKFVKRAPFKLSCHDSRGPGAFDHLISRRFVNFTGAKIAVWLLGSAAPDLVPISSSGFKSSMLVTLVMVFKTRTSPEVGPK